MDSTIVRRRVISGFAWQGATKAVVQVASWISTVFVARMLSPSDYGVVAAAGVFINFLLLVTEMGLSQGLIQRKESDPCLDDGVFYLSLLAGFGTYGALYLAAPLVADFYRMPIITELLRVAGLSLLFSSLITVPLAIAMRELDFRQRSLIQMASGLCSTVTVVGMAWSGFGVWSLVGGTLATHVTSAIGFLSRMRRFPRPQFPLKESLALLNYGLQVTGNRFLNVLWSGSDAFVIGRVLGDKLLGFYAMAAQLSSMPLEKVGSIFNYVLFPAISRLNDQPEEARRLFLDAHRALLLIGLPLLAGLALVAHDAVVLLLTGKWLPLVPLLQGLCVVNMLRLSGMTMPPILLARGRPGAMLRYNLGMLLLLPAAIYFGMEWGIVGAVYAWLIIYPLMYLFLAVLTLRELRLGALQLVASALPALAATGLMAMVVAGVQELAPDAPLARLLLGAGAGVVSYAVGLAILFRGRVGDLRHYFRRLREARARKGAADRDRGDETKEAAVEQPSGSGSRS